MMICIKLTVMLLKIPPSGNIRRETLKRSLYNHHSTKICHTAHSLNFANNPQCPNSAVVFIGKDDFYSFISPKYLCKSKISALNTVFIMGNKRNRRSRKVESQSSDRDENTSETRFTQSNATLVDVSENVNNIFDRKLGSELTEPSQICNEIETITQRLCEKNSHKLTQSEQQLNSKFEEILKEIRTNRDSNLANDEGDAENNR